MPYFRKVKTKGGEIHWQARVFAGRDGNGKAIMLVKTIPSANKKDAERWARDRLAERDRGELVTGKYTVNALLDDLVLNLKINRRSEWGRLVVDAHLRPYFGGLRADQVTTTVLQQYVAKRQAEGRANATINRELAGLKRALRLGREATPAKVARVPAFPRLAEAPPRKGFFEFGDYEAMLAALPEELKPVLVFAYHTGCRRGEILRMQWPQVDLAERVVRLEPGTTKNREARTIPLVEDLWQVLCMQRDLRDRYHPRTPWVFFRHATGGPLKDFRGAWESACKKAGLWDAATGRPTRLLHDLRRTAVRNLTRAGVPERVAMAVSGHKTRSVFDRYNITNEADLRRAAERLGEYLAANRRKRAEESSTRVVREAGPGVAGASENAPKLLN